MSAHLFLAVGMIGMAVAIFWLGWSASTMWREWKDDRALRAAEARYERHHHRKGGPVPAGLVELPHSGRLAVEPDPDDWRFFGESEQGWASESAEYELLTQRIAQATEAPTIGSLDWTAQQLAAVRADETAEQPVSVTGEPPIDTGELLAITDRVESWIAAWTAQGNVDRHTIQAPDV